MRYEIAENERLAKAFASSEAACLIQLQSKDAEIERLRAALEKIANSGQGVNASWLIADAREALAGPKVG